MGLEAQLGREQGECGASQPGSGSCLHMHTLALGAASLGEQPRGLLLLPANTWTRPLPMHLAGK